MGVPALFRWLNTKYPKITSKVIEELPVQVSADQPPIPVDLSKPNPNGWEVDNLYLDMNGIVHPCTHPEDKPPPRNEDEAMVEIFKYLDRIMAMVRPRKLLYMAIDGVAPRAKMNQQRSRRFRAAQDAQIQYQAEERIREELRAAGKPVLSKEEQPDRFDSNCITPGTPFMRRLAECLRYYIADKLNSCSGWRNLKIILSDASVPGEGEHKIMDYIRHQRASSRHDPNTHHVLYGLDADLIMLALATHEPHFRILREDVFAQDSRGRGCFMCGQEGHQASECTGKISGTLEKKPQPPKPFIYLHVNVLREYLEFEMTVPGLSFPFDLERVMDDWVFMCFFVGNDFLPHLPSLEIREGAIDTLIGIYKRNLAKMGGYMSENGIVHLDRLQIMMEDLGRMEEEIFRKRRETEERRMEGARRRKEAQEERAAAYTAQTSGRVPPSKMNERMREFGKQSVPVADKAAVHQSNVVYAAQLQQQNASVKTANASAAKALRASLLSSKKNGDDTDKKEAVVDGGGDGGELHRKRKIDQVDEPDEPVERKAELDAEALSAEATKAATEDDIAVPPVAAVVGDEVDEEEDDDDDDNAKLKVVVAEADNVVEVVVVKKAAAEPEEPVDEVRLWEEGWRERYYESKFGVSVKDTEFRKKLVHAYVEGLCWVLQYYYQGCQSWKWYYPFHYSPFASDFSVTELIKEMKVHFEKSKPFQPLEQLMGVLPAGSKDHIPEPFHPLMTDPESAIIDFYPQDFRIDLNGKKFAWQGVAILPFIDEKRLLSAMEDVYKVLTEDQRSLNRTGHDLLFLGQNHALFEYLCEYFGKKRPVEPVELDARLSAKFAGSFLPDDDAVLPGSTYYSPLPDYGMEDVQDNSCIDVFYFNPAPPTPDYLFQATILPGVKFENRCLQREDGMHLQRGGQRGTFGPPQPQQQQRAGYGGQDYNRNRGPPPPSSSYHQYQQNGGRYDNNSQRRDSGPSSYCGPNSSRPGSGGGNSYRGGQSGANYAQSGSAYYRSDNAYPPAPQQYPNMTPYGGYPSGPSPYTPYGGYSAPQQAYSNPNTPYDGYLPPQPYPAPQGYQQQQQHSRPPPGPNLAWSRNLQSGQKQRRR